MVKQIDRVYQDINLIDFFQGGLKGSLMLIQQEQDALIIEFISAGAS